MSCVVHGNRGGDAPGACADDCDSAATPPASDTSFHRNILVTHNLVFVSTDQHIYAIDLSTHQAVWNIPKSGTLALSRNGVLLITTGATISDGNLVAIKLQ